MTRTRKPPTSVIAWAWWSPTGGLTGFAYPQVLSVPSRPVFRDSQVRQVSIALIDTPRPRKRKRKRAKRKGATRATRA